MNRLVPLGAALGLAAAAGSAGAQALVPLTVRLAPSFTSYKLGDPLDRTISQFAIPVAVVVPIMGRLTVDLATAYATSKLEAGGSEGEISGLTDTQVRANYTFGNDAVILTAGVNIPTGQKTVDFATQGDAARQIGNDFFGFPISNMGTGFAGTGGIAAARTFGSWNLGAGASFRYAGQYEPYESVPGLTEPLRYQPGNEYRVRVGADRQLLRGGVALGLTFSKFGEDQAGDFAYGVGDRLVAQGAYAATLGGVDVALTAWNLYRFAGDDPEGRDNETPSDNIADITVAAGFRVAGLVLEPNVGIRGWAQDGGRAAQMIQAGLRSRIDAGPIAIFPSVGFATGSVESGGSESASLTGLRGTLTLRFVP